jgi:hypothetical protein
MIYSESFTDILKLNLYMVGNNIERRDIINIAYNFNPRGKWLYKLIYWKDAQRMLLENL